MTIAIDGPSAVGKSSVGEALARRLGYRFLDTGVMYRAVTHLALRSGLPLNDEAKLGTLASSCRITTRRPAPDAPQRVYVNGEDVTEALNAREVEADVSQVSKVAAVRKALVRQQQGIAKGGGIVMVGRDIGTVVLPKATHKFYLTASAKARARRRWNQMNGEPASYDAVLADMKRRDTIDSTRPISPLRPAADATIVDTANLTFDQVVEMLYRHITRT
ncbi:MAG: (d)CMP kinase [Chloroflexi bacterium]|nr:(d)CMP kinase [Chloroflexota bacterium]